jgi:hypothetical protein
MVRLHWPLTPGERLFVGLLIAITVVAGVVMFAHSL